MTYDVIVIGGGAAGLSAAVALGRARRSVLVVDGGAPRNAPAAGVHVLLGREGVAPSELLAAGRDEVARYGGEFRDGVVIDAVRDGDGDADPFRVTLEDGSSLRARRLLIATGLVDELPPEVDGLAERWGRDVIHCPYCHGYEHADEPIGVLGVSPLSPHHALLFRQWSADLLYFRHTAPELDPEQAEQLAARGIEVVEGEVTGLEIEADRISGVRLADGTVVPRTVIAAGGRMAVKRTGLDHLGIGVIEHPLGLGEHIEVDPTGLTAVPGVFAAGNATDLLAQVGGAADHGVRTGAAINADLIAEETTAAVAAYRDAAH